MVGQFFADSIEVLEDVPLGLDRIVCRGRHESDTNLSGYVAKFCLLQRVPPEQDDRAVSLLGGSPRKFRVGHVGTIPAYKLDIRGRLMGEALGQDRVV